MPKPKVTLRETTESDLELMLAWRSNSIVYEKHYEQGYLNKGILIWGEHYKWWKNLKSWKNWIIELDDKITRRRSVGSIWFSSLNTNAPDIGIYIGEVSLWNKGIGRDAIILALEWLKTQRYEKVSAKIIKNNRRSMGLFESLGFEKLGDSREGEWKYELGL